MKKYFIFSGDLQTFFFLPDICGHLRTADLSLSNDCII